MIKVENLSYSFPEKILYENITFTLEEGQHCAFIGSSGVGKSTLIDLIIDPEKYMFDGSLEIDPACKIGYLRQFYKTDSIKEITVFEYIGEKSIALQEEITELYLQMENSADIDSLLEKEKELTDRFESLGGYDFENNINKKLNLANLIFLKNRDISELSGGEFKLIQLIKVMQGSPHLIIMDEADVFLDFENLNSLKNLINSYKGTLLVITHNRYLLSHCFNKILHLENMMLNEFNGRYVDYNFSLLEKKIELQELAYEDSEEIKRNEVLIQRFRERAAENSEASIGQHVNSRVKIQERLKARRVRAPFVYINEPDISFKDDIEIREDLALEVKDYNLSFDESLLEDINFEIKAGDKVVLIGPNGSGKTTLLRDIFLNKDPAIELKDYVTTAYLSQVQGEMLNESKTINQEFFDAGFKSYDEILSTILNYGLEGELVDQKISSLSGGEKNLLQLAKISKSNANMLLLDEPTCHLDSYSQLALEKALSSYKGTILMVSHDYYSIVNSMDYVLIIEDKKIRKMSMRKFRKMIYASHFNRDYLEIEEKIKNLENKIAFALKENDFTSAKVLSEDLKDLIELF